MKEYIILKYIILMAILTNTVFENFAMDLDKDINLLDKLPTELVSLILRKLDIRSLKEMKLVSKKLRLSVLSEYCHEKEASSYRWALLKKFVVNPNDYLSLDINKRYKVSLIDSKNAKIFDVVLRKSIDIDLEQQGRKYPNVNEDDEEDDEEAGYLQQCLIVSNNNKFFVNFRQGGTNINIWDIKTGFFLKCLVFEEQPIISVNISNDDKFLLITLDNNENMFLWDIEKNNISQTFNSGPERLTVRSVDSNFIIASTNTLRWRSANRNQIKIWDTKTGKMICNLTGYNIIAGLVEVTKDSKFIISSSINQLKIFNVNNSECKNIELGNNYRIRSMMVTSDNKLLVTSSGENLIQVWDIENGNCLKTIQGIDESRFSQHGAFISPNNKLIISGSDYNVEIWDMKTGKLIQNIERQFGQDKIPIREIKIGKDSSYLLISYYKVGTDMVNISTGEIIHTFLNNNTDENLIKIVNYRDNLISYALDGSIESIWAVQEKNFLIT